MQFGVALPSFISDPERQRLAKLCFASLLKTDVRPLSRKPMLLLMVRRGEIVFDYPKIEAMSEDWTPIVINDPSGIQGVEKSLAYGTSKLVEMGCDYVTWMGNDSLFHPRWLLELKGVIERHPDAVAWSCYRSANVKTHVNLEERDGDVSVTSIGYGMTFSKQEWLDSKIATQPDWNSPYGDTMDLWHMWKRPGERWVTGKSWIEHTGRWGEHCRPEVPEWAIDFQGIE